jgi:hypothetical protein
MQQIWASDVYVEMHSLALLGVVLWSSLANSRAIFQSNLGPFNHMDPSAGSFPRIPDEWNREIIKTVATPSGVGNVQNADGSFDPKTNAFIEPTQVKKRKRAAVAGTKTSCMQNPIKNTDTIMDTPVPHTGDVIAPQHENEVTGPAVMNNRDQMLLDKSSSMSRRNCDETESVMRALYHQVEKLARRPGCALEEGIYLDSIMTHIPYVEVLQQMFGGSALTDSACVPVVTRAYEESYMREVLSGVDEPCIMGSNCECQFIDEHNPFTGVQFTLPVEAFSTKATAAGMMEQLSSNKLCVLCCRKHTQSLFYEALYNHRAYSACIQLYGNICDCPGEYAKEAMLICPLSGPINNMPLPVVAHQRNRYSVVVHNGVRQLRQHRVAYEDFHVPSLSRC